MLLAGDEKNGKMASFAAQYPHIIDVTQMWEAPVWKSQFGELTFLAQFAFFKYLAEDYRVIHVGMRSGMLESMALLGMETFYLEDRGSGSGNRMIGFSNAGITYTRIQIAEAPGLTGRISQQKQLYSPAQVEKRIDEKANRHKNRRGFTKNFGGYKGDTDWAARGYAKADLLRSPVEDQDYDTGNQWEELTMDLRRLRGFRNTDFAEITRLVEGKFRV